MFAPAINEIKLNPLHWVKSANRHRWCRHSTHLLAQANITPVNERLLHKPARNKIVHRCCKPLMHFIRTCVKHFFMSGPDAVSSSQFETWEKLSLGV